MRAYDLIMKKRNAEALSEAELRWLIAGYTDGSVPDYQMAAFAMAVYFNGMSAAELSAFTDAMLRSGEVLELAATKARKVDKHSTGGVGDKISLPLAPAVAACGVPVPMVSGRGLGHTGGTLDKLESIPGFRTDLSTSDYKRLVAELGCCLIGQTAQVAPADKKLYALRDVTATVDCIPLIASSIMSKKLAEGIDALVLDVKVGSGAFMKKKEDALKLAETMVGIGAHMGKDVVARLTNMDQPLGVMVGNALEVQESLDVLEGGGPEDIVKLTVELGAEMLVLGGVAEDIEHGRQQLQAALNDGRAMQKFAEIIEAQGGDPRVIDDRSRLPSTTERVDLTAPQDGTIAGVDTEAVGIASMLIGGGRAKAEDSIDPRVGLEVKARIGDVVKKGQPLCTLHVADIPAEAALSRLATAFHFSEEAVEAPALLMERLCSPPA